MFISITISFDRKGILSDSSRQAFLRLNFAEKIGATFEEFKGKYKFNEREDLYLAFQEVNVIGAPETVKIELIVKELPLNWEKQKNFAETLKLEAAIRLRAHKSFEERGKVVLHLNSDEDGGKIEVFTYK
jgi:hypothetical protein